jgi:uncharacterized protein involved in outer membrane biogenesis
MVNSTPTDSFDDPTPRIVIPRWAKITAGVLAVIIVISLIVPQFIDQEKYRALAVEKVKEATGYDVAWDGNIGLRLLPLPSVHVKALHVKNNGDDLVKVDSASVSVALLPLLSGNIEIANITLEKPVVTLRKLRNGAFNWEGLASSNNQASSPSQNTSQETTQSFRLDRLTIHDGYISFKDDAKNSEQILKDMNVTLKAQSLTGPFDATGSIIYNDKKIKLDVQSGSVTGQDKSYPLKAQLSLPDNFVDLTFNGVLAAQETLTAKGDVEIVSKNLQKTIHSFAPSANIPSALHENLQFKSAIDYGADRVALTAMALNIGALSWLGEVTVNGLRDPENSAVSLNLTPQKSESASKDPLLELLQSTSLQGQGKLIASGGVALDQMNIRFAGNDITLDGSVKTDAAKPVLNMNLVSKTLDVDQLRQNITKVSAPQPDKKSTSSQKGESQKGAGLPFTGTLGFKIDNLIFDQKTYKNVSGGVSAREKALTLNNIKADLPVESSVRVNGTIANSTALSGMDINFDFDTKNLEDLLKLYEQKPLPIKQTIGAFSARGNVTGDLQNINFAVDTSALNFDVKANGAVKNVTATPELNAVKLAVSHPDIIGAIRTFNPQFQPIAGLSGSLNVSSLVSWADKTVDLKDIKGNLGRADVDGNVQIIQASVPRVTGQLNFGNLNFTTSESVASGGGAAGRASAAGPRWSREAINTAWMRAFEADLKITANSITKNLWKFQNANLDFDLKDGVLTVTDMSAKALGGSAKMNGTVKAGASDSDGLSLNWTAAMSNIDARQLQSALTSKPSDTLNGTITSFDTKISGNGVSPAALVQSLSGNGTVVGQNIVVKGIDAAALVETARGSFKPLERAGSLFGSFQKGQTEFTTLNIAYDITAGVVNFSKLNLDGPSAKIDSTGNVNLPRWTIDLKNTMTVKNTDIPPFDFVISGPLDNPLQTGGSIIENYLRERAQKKVQKLIGKELEKRFGIPMGGAEETVPVPADGTVAPTEQPTAPATPKDALKNILGDPNTQKAIEGLFR